MNMHLCLIGVLTLSFLYGCDRSSQSDTNLVLASSEAQIRAAKKADEAREREAKTAECRADMDAKVADYHKLIANKEYWPAVLRIRFCAQLLDDPKLRELVAEGEILSYRQNIDNPKLSDFDRLRAGESFERDYPDQAEKYQRTISSLRLRVEVNQANNGRMNSDRSYASSEINSIARNSVARNCFLAAGAPDPLLFPNHQVTPSQLTSIANCMQPYLKR